MTVGRMESSPALVTYPPTMSAMGPPQVNFKHEEVKVPTSLSEDEVLVDVVACGICHSDVVLAMIPQPEAYPRILGHEGAGYVRAVGSNVTHVKEGDAVVLSFAYCKSCKKCDTGHPAYCNKWNPINIFNQEVKYQHAEKGEDVTAGFFGQSSFSKIAKVNATSVVNVTDIIKSKEELKLFAPMGCGFQTGAASTIIAGNCTSDDTVVVIGLGGVGLAALMAAKIQGCKTIIGVDLVQSRLDMATEVGATHTVQSTQNTQDLEDAIRKIIPEGPSLVLDTTGLPTILESSLRFSGEQGRVVLVGIPKRGATMTVDLSPFLMAAKTLTATIEGDADPHKFIPEMIQWYRDGKFPIDKFIKTFPAADHEKAFAGMRDGSTIKPVLEW